MKKVFNDWIPFKGFICMTVLWWIFIRNDKKYKFTHRVERHESIHSYQQTCILIATLIITLLLIAFADIAWYWIFNIFITPFLLYVLCWIIEIILPPYNKAYKDICFESEANYLEDDPNWKSKVFPGSFLKYIKNKNYGKSLTKTK